MSKELSVQEKLELAKTMSVSSLLPRQYQNNPGNMLYAIEYAEALDVPRMTAITGIHVIEGKPSASAQLIAALVRRAGHKLRVTFDRQAMAARAVVIRTDDPDFEFVSEWTLDRAKSAGLTGKGVWKSYPDAMLKARAITEVARDAASEALFGIIYTAEELGADEVDQDGAYVGGSVTTVQVAHPADVVAEPARDWVAEAEALAVAGDLDGLRELHAEARRAGIDRATDAAIVALGKALAEKVAAEAAEVVDAEVVEDDADAAADAEVSEWELNTDGPFDGEVAA